jgi:hypothetical protein
MKIIIVTEGGGQSTYEYERLAEMWKDGLLKAETLYWKEGMIDWRPLRELFEGISPPPVPPAATPPVTTIRHKKVPLKKAKRVESFRWTKEPHMLTATLIFLILSCGIFDLINAWSNYEQLLLFQDLNNGLTVDDSVLERNEEREEIISICIFAIFIVTGIVFAKWTHQAVVNSRGFGSKSMKYTPGWAAAYYFIPIINIYKPYKVMMEVWKVSMNPNNWQNQGGTLLISFWWYSWIIVGYVGIAVSKQFFKSETLEAYIQAYQLYIAHDVANFIVALLAILVVNTIYNNQKRLVIAQ